MPAIQPRDPESSFGYSLTNFRRMEPHILQVVRRFPDTTIFHPQVHRPSSFSVYFRQACQAFIHEKCYWASELTKEEVYATWEAGLTLRVHNGNGTVTACPKAHDETKRKNTAIVELPGTAIDVTNDAELLRALCVLKNKDIVTVPIQITGLNPSAIPALADEYPNISIGEDSTGRHTIY